MPLRQSVFLINHCSSFGFLLEGKKFSTDAMAVCRNSATESGQGA